MQHPVLVAVVLFPVMLRTRTPAVERFIRTACARVDQMGRFHLDEPIVMVQVDDLAARAALALVASPDFGAGRFVFGPRVTNNRLPLASPREASAELALEGIQE